jgi:RHH-type transcriptional regulator, rel operon repressor / antitoxin RelB
MFAIQLPRSIEKRFTKLAHRTGRTKTSHVREAILNHLEDFEDVYIAERTLKQILTGKERTIPLEKLIKRYGLKKNN